MLRILPFMRTSNGGIMSQNRSRVGEPDARWEKAMKQISIRIGVALLAFFIGFVASTIRLRLSVGNPQNAFSPVSFRDEEWHRLYEAAGMSGDGTIRQEVSDRLLCANKAGVPDAWPINIEGAVWCYRADRTSHQLMMNDTSEYGSFSKRITSSHSTWTRENLDFIRTVSTAKRAKAYVATHEWPSGK
jgi:hypothetical protein